MARGLHVRVEGLDRTTKYLTRVGESARQAGRTRMTVGSDLVYGYGIETGRRRSGRLARRAGGAYMLRDGVAEGRPRMVRMLEQAIVAGTNAGLVLGNAGRAIVAAVRRRTPVVSGNLRDSFRAGVR